MKRIKLIAATALILIAAWLVPPIIHRARGLCPIKPDGVRQADALPNFARKYGMSCAVCHTTIPRLNQVGYNYRRAGFRMPDELGQEAKFDGLKDMYAAIVRVDLNVTTTATDPDADNAVVPASHKLASPELSLHPISGSFGKWWSVRSELAFSPGEEVGVEQGYARATYPYKDWIFSTRAGIFHPIEGYGASDDSLGAFKPMIFDHAPRNGAFNALVGLLSRSQLGAEAGIAYKDSTLSFAVLNGYNSVKDASNVGADRNQHDLRLFFNQMLGERAAFNVFYLNGKTGFPTDVTAAVTDTTGANPVRWINNYQRLATFANYEVLGEKLNLLGGFAIGKDHFPQVLTAATNNSDSFNNYGWFAEAQSKLHEHFTGGVRYDTFKPSTRTGNNRESAVTFTAAVPIENVKLLADYQIHRTQSPVGKDRTDNVVVLEWLMAF